MIEYSGTQKGGKMQKNLIGVGELSHETKISIRTLDRYRRAGLIVPVCEIGRRYFYAKDTIKLVNELFTAKQTRGKNHD